MTAGASAEALDDRERNASRLQKGMPAASSYSRADATDDSWMSSRMQRKLGGTLLHHRPASALGTPVALMDPILAQVAEDCEKAQPTAADCRFAAQVATDMSEGYRDEDARVEVMQRLLLEEYGQSFIRMSISKGITDGSLLHRSGALYGNMEVKNEVGAGGGSIHVQNAAYAALHATGPGRKSVRDRCVCPTLLLEVAGPNLSLSGAVFSNVAVCDPLSPMVSLLWLPHSPLMLQAARCFAAIRRALPALDHFYDSLEGQQQPPSRQLEYPYPCSFMDGRGSEVHFRYTGMLNRLVFTATAGEQQLVIKFTRSYSAAAHRTAHAAGFAPALLGLRELTDSWLMVVMQQVTSNIATPQSECVGCVMDFLYTALNIYC